MILPDSFVADLESLTAVLDDPDVDLRATVGDLVAAAGAAVAGFAGLSLTVDVEGGPVRFTLLEADVVPESVRTSVALPLTILTAGAVRGRLVLFATRPGSLVDLAADLTWSTGAQPGEALLDQHLELAFSAGAPSGLAQLRSLHQAIGVLIARGLSPVQARDHIYDLVENHGQDHASAAEQILAALDDTGHPEAHQPSRPEDDDRRTF